MVALLSAHSCCDLFMTATFFVKGDFSLVGHQALEIKRQNTECKLVFGSKIKNFLIKIDKCVGFRLKYKERHNFRKKISGGL